MKAIGCKRVVISAAGLLLAAQAGVALADENSAAEQSTTTGGQQQDFSQVDQNSDSQAEWDELEQAYGDQLAQNNWDERQVMDSFDRDQDSALDEMEYQIFVVALEEQQQNQTAGTGQQAAGSTGMGSAAGSAQSDRQASTDAQSQQQNAESGQTQTGQEQQESFAAAGELAADNGQAYGQQNQQAQQGQQGQQQSRQGQQQAQQGQQGQSAAQVSLANGEQVPLEQIQDSELTNLSGESLGTVQDVVQSQTGGETALVVNVGGFWGFGGKEILVDTSEVRMNQNNELVWETSASESELQSRPEYNQQDYVSIR